MPSSITTPLGISVLERKALEHIIEAGSEVVSTRGKILLELATGKNLTKIRKEMGISGSVVNRWRNRWLSSTLAPQNWDDAVKKVEEIIGVGMGRPKKVKAASEVSKIIELSEWSRAKKPCKSKHQHNKLVAVAASSNGLPEMSPRTIGRLLEEYKNGCEKSPC